MYLPILTVLFKVIARAITLQNDVENYSYKQCTFYYYYYCPLITPMKGVKQPVRRLNIIQQMQRLYNLTQQDFHNLSIV